MRGLIAVVEDDPVLCRNLARGLDAEGFVISWTASTGAAALTHAAGPTRPDALILDLGLPDTDGVDLLTALRSHGLDAPVLVLSARTAVTDRLAAFGAGADDHVCKPFALAEVAARLDVLIRRHSPAAAEVDLVLDPIQHRLVCGDRAATLSPTEYRILGALLARRGQIVRRAALVGAAWPPGAHVAQNTLDSYLARLRGALREVGAEVAIETARGVGYRIGVAVPE